jgi:hypothetical protein
MVPPTAASLTLLGLACSPAGTRLDLKGLGKKIPVVEFSASVPEIESQ